MLNLSIETSGVGYASAFTGNFSFLLAILIGVAATYFVFSSARKMGGGLFGVVLKYMGFGMVFIVLGAVSVVLRPFLISVWQELIQTVLFSLGFVFLVLGAQKLLKGITIN